MNRYKDTINAHANDTLVLEELSRLLSVIYQEYEKTRLQSDLDIINKLREVIRYYDLRNNG
jgi:hypothetical protein